MYCVEDCFASIYVEQFCRKDYNYVVHRSFGAIFNDASKCFCVRNETSIIDASVLDAT